MLLVNDALVGRYRGWRGHLCSGARSSVWAQLPREVRDEHRSHFGERRQRRP